MNYWNFLTTLIWPLFLIWFIRKYHIQIEAFLKTLKDWRKLSAPGMSLERTDENITIKPPPEALTQRAHPQEELQEGLPDEAKKVISTLWIHQKEYFPDNVRKGRWSFVVGFGAPRYTDFLIGVGILLKKGLATIDPQRGQWILTEAGIYYCEHNPDKLINDWNFEKWKL